MFTSTSESDREVHRIVAAKSMLEGGGFEVYRPFPSANADWFDPFLLLDEMAPNVQAPGEVVGAPPHPHRGFETVTYVLQGEVEHRDSADNQGTIGPNDVQWMTAGDGIIHSETPSTKLQIEGGILHGLQLWVNLPANLRRTQPAYQAIRADGIPTISGEGWTASVVAGNMLGVTGPATTHTPIGYARLTLQPGAELRLPTTDGHTALIYAFEGEGLVGASGKKLRSQHLAVFDRSGGDVRLGVPAEAEAPLDCILLTGEPIAEPMARYGPFVMNTVAELDEALADFEAGRMGSISPTGTA